MVSGVPFNRKGKKQPLLSGHVTDLYDAREGRTKIMVCKVPRNSRGKTRLGLYMNK